MPPGRSEPIDCSCLHRLHLCLLTISPFCSRLRGVWSSSSLPCSGPFAPFWWASDVVLAEYARTCADVLCTLSVVLVLVCRPVCGVQEIGSVSLSASSLGQWPLPLLSSMRKLRTFITDADPTSHRVRLWRGGSASSLFFYLFFYSFVEYVDIDTSTYIKAPGPHCGAEGRWRIVGLTVSASV